jgi:hypothetical protein
MRAHTGTSPCAARTGNGRSVNPQRFRGHPDRAAALRAAVADAFDCSKNGDPAQVIGQSEDGSF